MNKWVILVIIVIVIIILGIGGYLLYIQMTTPKPCGSCAGSPSPSSSASGALDNKNAGIIFLHHSTGQVIWDGGVSDWFTDYNIKNSTNYEITEQVFPKDSPYGWNNYPYDYYNIWVKNGSGMEYKTEPTLNALTKDYNVIIFKHCFPVSDIEANTGNSDINSETKSIENYQLQYDALKEKMHQYKNTKFIVWTGAAEVEGASNNEYAERAETFFKWVKNEWDENDDNIFIFDFRELETEGGLYLKNGYAASVTDSHPNETFAKRVAPIFGQRIVDVINGQGDK